MSKYFIEISNNRQPKNRAEKDVLALYAYHQKMIFGDDNKRKFIVSVINFITDINAKNSKCKDLQFSSIDIDGDEHIYIDDICAVHFKEVMGTAKWDIEKMHIR